MDRLTDRDTHTGRQKQTQIPLIFFSQRTSFVDFQGYIKDYRPHLVTESSGRYLLLVRI